MNHVGEYQHETRNMKAESEFEEPYRRAGLRLEHGAQFGALRRDLNRLRLGARFLAEKTKRHTQTKHNR
jgi:hypothetical protein